MITVRKAQDRGHFDFGWLDTYHTFSFGDYHDPDFMGFRDLRVINEDRVQPGEGFPTHGHRDMEIITYVLEGSIQHKDSMGNGSIIKPGEVQKMSAGTGVTHSEYNPSKTDPLHLLQIWIMPDSHGLKPNYEQKSIFQTKEAGKLELIAAPPGQEDAITVHQDVKIYAGKLSAKAAVGHDLLPSRYAWVQCAHGKIVLNKTTLSAGDGAAIQAEPHFTIQAKEDSEFLLFDLK